RSRRCRDRRLCAATRLRGTGGAPLALRTGPGTVPGRSRSMSLTRRQFLAAGLGAAGTLATGVGPGAHGLPLLAREDLIPGQAPDITLDPASWTTTADHVSFVALGDNGSGGRQAMAVAEQMAETYRDHPYGNVVLLGDICYYGKFDDRYQDVFVRPMGP